MLLLLVLLDEQMWQNQGKWDVIASEPLELTSSDKLLQHQDSERKKEKEAKEPKALRL